MVTTVDNTKIGIVLQEIQTNTDSNRHNELFRNLVQSLRQRGLPGVTDGVNYIADRLENESHLREAFSKMLNTLLNQRDCHTLFTQSGIPTGSGFSAQFFRQLKHRILPPLADKRSLNYLLQKAFYKKNDYRWVQQVPDEVWMRLFNNIQIEVYAPNTPLRTYLNNALTILSYRVSSLGMEDDINKRFLSDQNLQSPFLEQNNLTLQFTQLDNSATEAYRIMLSDNIINKLNECEAVLKEIKANSHRFGTSLEQTYLLGRTRQQVQRMRYIVYLLSSHDDHQEELKTTVQFFKEIIEAENRRHNIFDLLQQNIGMLAYQIAEHKGNTGEHYITITRREYVTFFNTAMGGGAIISVIAMFKTLLHHVPFAPFWEYFMYGLNYAIGFVLLQVTHTTLATKQPAMTASTLASYLDERKYKNPLENVAQSFVLAWRSQTASFVGNLIIVFPLSYLLAFGWHHLSGHKLVAGQAAWDYLNNQNPTKSLAWLYACFTGVFLFLSGLVMGYVDNKVRFSNIAARVREQPLLTRVLSGPTRNKLASYIDHNLGGWAGNIFLGFALGFAPVIGKIFGIPFDIRHITISTAQFAMGLYGLDNQLPLRELITVIIGVLGIGFCNFMTSFGLAFWVALRSRGLYLRHYTRLIPLVLRHFIMRPWDFFMPPKKTKS
ncbi:site-specific recombinase [Taibaiella soli]|nr:site-specific recombinase [Taibaiella soli]